MSESHIMIERFLSDILVNLFFIRNLVVFKFRLLFKKNPKSGMRFIQVQNHFVTFRNYEVINVVKHQLLKILKKNFFFTSTKYSVVRN